ncbi:hypothetical protein BJY00DRAFT_42581 [Aspergillus carlsbadensis]|nr:hypothetical protein BJY00DRAFT_42581 [Aspergillus carlsbadensis]
MLRSAWSAVASCSSPVPLTWTPGVPNRGIAAAAIMPCSSDYSIPIHPHFGSRFESVSKTQRDCHLAHGQDTLLPTACSVMTRLLATCLSSLRFGCRPPRSCFVARGTLQGVMFRGLQANNSEYLESWIWHHLCVHALVRSSWSRPTVIEVWFYYMRSPVFRFVVCSNSS